VRDDRERLLDIHEAIERIEKYAGGGRDALARDELIQTWMVHYLQIIGEAARSLSANLRTQHPEIPWSQIIGMRNILTHHYFGIDVDIVWSAVAHDLPDLKRKVEAILQAMGDNN
jgi:uncharacterized protein with HEPN domain